MRTMEGYIRAIAGSFVLLSLALGYISAHIGTFSPLL